MKTLIIFTIIVASVAMLLASCQTIEQPHRDQKRASTVRAKRSGPFSPYYQSTAEGDYYYKAETDTNENYRPQLKRNFSGRGN